MLARLLRLSALVVCTKLLAVGVSAQTRQTETALRATAAEQRTSMAFDAAKKMGKPELYAFLKPMPKGADLHMHLSGAVYAETFIAEAVKQGMCIAPVEAGEPAVPVGQAAVRLAPPAEKDGACAPHAVPAAEALKKQKLYDDLIDSFSMRAFVPTEGIDGHDQFFATFERFGVLKSSEGEWLDEIATRAAAQNEQYLEIMNTPTSTHAIAAGYRVGWPAGVDDDSYKAALPKLREELFAAGLREDVATDRNELQQALNARRRAEHCEEPRSSAACAVTIHWLFQVLRGFPPQQVFAQTLLGFELASSDPEVVGINFVMPEDGRISMQDYHLQMLMLDYLHSVYPSVHISLHAGELSPGMVPPAGLGFHIREAVELGHAERIGHGVDVLYEEHAGELLKHLADKHVMVEINLTSNDVILGIKGSDSPLAAYRAAHVPVALSTDDEGVSRIDLTHEYVKGALEQNLSYLDLKKMARTSLQHAFLAGASLWENPDDFTRFNKSCGSQATTTTLSPACATFLQGNEKARLQWQLEQRFSAFEASVH